MQWLRGPSNGVPLVAQRAFEGRDRARAAVVSLGDRAGRPPALSVDSLGTARLQFLDADGRVTFSLPGERR